MYNINIIMIYGTYIINQILLYIKPGTVKVFYKKVLINLYKALYRHFTHTLAHTHNTLIFNQTMT